MEIDRSDLTLLQHILDSLVLQAERYRRAANELGLPPDPYLNLEREAREASKLAHRLDRGGS